MNIRHQYVAVQVEKNRAHGRAMLEGIADYALAKTDWRLELVEPELLQDVSAVRKFDGLIVRVMDDVTADVLGRSRRLTDDVTLDEPTRGVTVAAATAVVTVPEEKTLTLSETVTYADGAKLTKKGAGALALGGAAVASDKVAAFKAAFKFVRTTPNTGCRLVEKPAGEGRVTLVAEVYPSGLLMIVR